MVLSHKELWKEGIPLKKLISLILAALLALSMLTMAFATTYTDKDTVKKVQQALNDASYDCGTPDGIAGKKTAAAITQYQSAKGIEVTGQIDDALLEALGIAVEAPEQPAEESEQADPASSGEEIQFISYEEAGFPSHVAIQDAKEVVGEWTGSSVWIVSDEKQLAADANDNAFFAAFGSGLKNNKLIITEDTYTISPMEGSMLEEEITSPWKLTEDGGIGTPKVDSDDIYTIYLGDDGTLPYDFYILGFNFRVFFSRNPEN